MSIRIDVEVEDSDMEVSQDEATVVDLATTDRKVDTHSKVEADLEEPMIQEAM